MRILGFMTGTSLDAVDIAVLDTDGHEILEFGPCGEFPLRDLTRECILEAIRDAFKWEIGQPEPASFTAAARVIAEEHYIAGCDFIREHGYSWADFDCLGVHGQTILHERPKRAESPPKLGRTVQLLDADFLAQLCGRPIVHAFRVADVAAGGEGAPLAPIYHAARARASGLKPPLAVLNIGGVANITLIWGSSDGDGQLTAFDTGPGCGPLDSLMQGAAAKAAGLDAPCDVDGIVSGSGTPDEAVLSRIMAHPFFSLPPPKSLDRYELISAADMEGLPLGDAAATLVACTAEAVARGLALAITQRDAGRAEAVEGRRSFAASAPAASFQCPFQDLIVCGGGRRNPTMMDALGKRLSPLGVHVRAAESVGWRGDAMEAEAFAFLAARVLRGLPISWPGTTGVHKPMTGGRVTLPRQTGHAGTA